MHGESTRRDFLQGKAALKAIDAVVDRASSSLPADEGERRSSTSEMPYLVRAARRAMACQFQVLWNASHDDEAMQSAIEALDLVDAVEEQLTVYRDSSEVMQINRRASEVPVVVERRLFQLLEHCNELSRETGGAFDITTGPLSKVWGFYRREGALPTDGAIAEALTYIGSDRLNLDQRDSSVRFERSGMELNLGSIGKGYAVDRACEVMESAGRTEFLIHGGQSSVLARGSEARADEKSDGWRIGVLHPWRDERLVELTLRNEALATSGSGTQFFRHGGKRYGHILDPRTGWPAERIFTSTVVAPTAAVADGLATAFYVMGVEKALAYCAGRPEIGAILVYAEDRGAVKIVSVNLKDDQWRQVNEV